MTKHKKQVFQKPEESTIANAPMKKKLSFFAAMMVVVGSCIGSGIFFKSQSVLGGSGGSIILAMFCWIFVAFGVICMALALIEIASARNDNLSLIGWCKTFNSRMTYKISKNFMFYLYTPIKGFFLPMYLITAFQDATASIYIQLGKPYHGFGTSVDWLIIMFIALAVSSYFIVMCGYSPKAGNIQNMMVTFVKFFPLTLAGVIGFVIFGMNAGEIAGKFNWGFNNIEPIKTLIDNGASFGSLFPAIGFFIAAAGIIYAYDGFYNVSGIQTEMKEPKKSSSALLIGLIVVTALYLIIALSMSLGSEDGSPRGLVSFFARHNILWLYAIFQISIAIGIVSVLNGYNMFSTRFAEDLVRMGELPFSHIGAKYLAKGNRFVGAIYNLAITLPVIIVFSIIGAFYLNNMGHEAQGYVVFGQQSTLGNLWNSIKDNQDIVKKLTLANNEETDYAVYTYGSRVSNLYSFNELVSNWSALFAFIFIITPLYGGIKNRKTNKVAVKKIKAYTPLAVVAIITMSLPIIFSLVAPIVDLITLAFIIESIKTGPNFATQYIIPRTLSLIMLIFYIALMTLPTVIEDRIAIKRHGSVARYEKLKQARIDKILQTNIA